MRNISFSLTQRQIKARTKTVTRRLGWKFVKPGDLLRAVDRCMGLKKGEKPKRLAVIRVVSVRREPLCSVWMYGPEEIDREGFEGMSRNAFVEMFCKHMKCTDTSPVTRIEFEYLQP